MSDIILELAIEEPILLEITQELPSYIWPTNTISLLKGDKGDPGTSFGIMETAAKSSATDAGTFGDISLTDDYIYFCVQTGIAGEAKWKKSLLFESL